MQLYGIICKSEHAGDALVIQGLCSAETVDSDGEVIKASAMREALPEYLRFPTLREMHQNSAVGTVTDAKVRDDGTTWIKARVIDERAITKIVENVYRGFSVGGRALARDPSDRKIITKLRLSEISVVDRPANEAALLSIAKAAGFTITADDDLALAMTKSALKRGWRGDAAVMGFLLSAKVR
jgi:hypothetical protein